MSGKPEEPTAEEKAAYADWLSRWESVHEEGDRRDWVKKWGYESDPEPYSPDERYGRDLDDWRRSELNRLQREAEAAEQKLLAKADVAAEQARQRVLNGVQS